MVKKPFLRTVNASLWKLGERHASIKRWLANERKYQRKDYAESTKQINRFE